MLSPSASSTSLPEPGGDALAASTELAARIRDEIGAAGGWIDFSRYMELALYTPGLGYYSGGSTKLGAAGDFVTAPELSAALAHALALTLKGELERAEAHEVLELGAGSGALAAQMLEAFARLDADVRYSILEPSADLRERQRAALRDFGDRVRWIDRLPDEPFVGAIVANEVLDALPVSVFVKRNGRAVACGVERSDQGFRWSERDAPALAASVDAIEQRLEARLPDGYRSEICPALQAFVGALGACLTRGAIVLVDYGLVAREYYHAQRSTGTLVCHYRHRAHENPFVYPGLQDITAWVDFSAVAAAAAVAGLAVGGFTTQGQYVLGTLAAAPPTLAVPLSPREQSALKTLVLPGEMGERFKVLLLRKALDGPPLPGRDFRGRL